MNKQTELGFIPNDWDIRKLGDIVEVNPSKIKVSDENINVSFLGMANVSEQAKIMSFSEKKYFEVSKGFTSFKNSDVLIAKITPCFENGKGAFVHSLINNIGFGSTEFHVLRHKKSVDPKFIYFHSISSRFRKLGESSMTGSAGQKRVQSEFLKLYLIGVPPLQEQKKIASILSTWDNAIEKTEKLIETKTKLKKALMQQLLTGKKRFKEFIKSNEYKQTELGFIPVDWCFFTLPNISTNGPQNGLYKHKSFYGKGFKIAELNDLYKYNNKLYVDNLKNYISLNEKEKEIYSLLEDDILINRVSKQISGVAKSLLVKNVTSNVIFESNMMRVTLNKKIIYPLFFIYFSKSKLYLEQIIGLAKVSNQTSISQEGLNKLNIPIPQLKEQIKIASVLTSCDKEIELLEKKLETLKNQKKGLMQKLLTGQIRVKIDI